VSVETLREALAVHVAARPSQALAIAPETGRTLTYAGLERDARRLAGCLRAAGLGRGDKVAFLLHNGYQTAAIFLGAMIGGYVVTPLNLLAQRAHLAYTLAHCDCKLVFTTAEREPRVREALAGVTRPVAVRVIDVDDPDAFAAAPEAELEPVAAGDPALLMYTSGTTGLPKGALLTQRNLLAAAQSVAAWHGLTPADRCLSALPLYHINGQVIATLTPLVSGGSFIAPQRFSVSAWWEQVERCEATWINVVPTIVAYLLAAAEPEREYAFPRVRFGRSASAPLPPENHKAFERRFGIPVIEAMGMTESASVVFANPQDPARRKYGSAGLPCGVEAKVIEPGDPGCAPLPEGVRGELMLRGPNVMGAYYNAPEVTARTLEPDGWLHTGDLGYRDADGYYFVTGRLKELIIKGGENIAPREIDEALLAHPAVLEAAAVGIPDGAYGQEIMACVVLKPDAACSAEALREHCLRELGRYKTPKVIRFVDELPKGPSGKVQRLKLAEAAE
jgi:long-chain acyl-CoA synthetase